MLLNIHPETPQERKIQQVVDLLRQGGVIIYPTDTVYGLGCDIMNKKAFERVCRIKGIQPDKAKFACICEDQSVVGQYTQPIDTPTYKLIKRALPGPYTFILPAGKAIPKYLQDSRKTIGIRVVDHAIPTAIVRELGNPILTTSLRSDDDIEDYLHDASLIFDRYKNEVDAVVDGGPGGLIPSTVVDCTEGEPQVVREGKGGLDLLS